MVMNKWWYLLFGIVLLVISFFIEKRVAFFFTSFRNPVFDYVTWFFSSTVRSFLVFFVIPIIILWFKDRNNALLFASGYLGVIIITYSLKFLVLRARPFSVLELPLLALISYKFALWDSSFPSSHASSSFSPFAAYEKYSLKWLWLFIALVSIFTRLYAGVHYLSDVVAGSLVGYFITKLVFWLDRKYRFSRVWKRMV